MGIDRRQLLSLGAVATGAAGAASLPAHAAPAPLGTFGIEAAHFGLRPGSGDDQSRALQSAIDAAARARAPLMIAPGIYRAGDLKLSSGVQIVGVRGATEIVLT